MNRKERLKSAVVNEKTLIVAVDIGSTEHWGYCRTKCGNEIKPFSFSVTRKGFDGFWDRISEFQKRQGCTEVVVGFESTGPYAESLVHYLRTKPVKMVQVNPMHTKRVKELEGNSPNKTDRKDPRVIATIIELGHSLSVVVPHGVAAALRRLTQARERAVADMTAKSHLIRQLIVIVFPEFSS